MKAGATRREGRKEQFPHCARNDRFCFLRRLADLKFGHYTEPKITLNPRCRPEGAALRGVKEENSSSLAALGMTGFVFETVDRSKVRPLHGTQDNVEPKMPA